MSPNDEPASPVGSTREQPAAGRSGSTRRRRRSPRRVLTARRWLLAAQAFAASCDNHAASPAPEANSLNGTEAEHVPTSSIRRTAVEPPHPVATPDQVIYHASGTEPFWQLQVKPSELRLVELDELKALSSKYTNEQQSGGHRYQSPELEVDVRYEPCDDGMSDRTYPHRVHVKYPQGTYDGCGWPAGYDLGPAP